MCPTTKGLKSNISATNLRHYLIKLNKIGISNNCSLLESSLWFSTNHQLVLLQKGVSRYLQIVWCRPLANPARDIIMGTMAWAKPSTKVTSIWQGNATQMCAYSNNNKPFRIFNPLWVRLWVTKRWNIYTICQLYILLCSAPDEDWLSTPLNSHSGAWLNAGEINLKGSHGKNILTSWHAQHKLEDKETNQWGIYKPTTGQDKICKCPLAGVPWRITLMVVLIINYLWSRVLHSCHSCRNIWNYAVFLYWGKRLRSKTWNKQKEL